MLDFHDQVALITGASRGIGLCVARQLASRGARVILASRSLEAVEARAGEIRSDGGAASALAMDISRAGEVRQALETLFEREKRLDILVNNAGIVRDNLMLRMKDEEWRAVLSTNLDGHFFVTRQVVKRMVRQRYGRIVSVSSVVGQTGNPGQVNYVASKAGLIGLTKALAREVASRNITVNAVAPGFIETDMTARLPDQARQGLLSGIPLERLGTVEDVAWGVLFLVSKEAGYITGHVLNINGGMYM